MSAILFPKFVKASLDKDIDQLVSLVRSHLEQDSLVSMNIENLLSKFGIGLIKSNIPYQASIVVNDTKASLQINIILKEQNYSHLEELFLVLHLLGHFLLDIQVRLLEENTETFAIVEHGSAIQRFYNLEKLDNEYSKDIFASELILPKKELKEFLDKNMDIDSISKFTGIDKKFIETKIKKDFSEFKTETFDSKSDIDGSQHILENKTILDQTNSSSDSISCFSKSFAASSYNQKQNQISSSNTSPNSKQIDTLNTKTSSSESFLNPNTSKGLQMLRDLARKTQVHS